MSCGKHQGSIVYIQTKEGEKGGKKGREGREREQTEEEENRDKHDRLFKYSVLYIFKEKKEII
jgi:hypothetical protein